MYHINTIVAVSLPSVKLLQLFHRFSPSLSVCLSLDVSLSLTIKDLQLNFTSTIIFVEPMVAFCCVVDIVIDTDIVPFFLCSLVVVDVVKLELFFYFILFLSAFFYSL